EVLFGPALVALGLQDDVVLLAGLDVGADPGRAQHGLQDRTDGARRDAQGRGLLAVQVDQQARAGRVVVEPHAAHGGGRARRRQHRLDPGVQGVVVVAAGDHLDGVAPSPATAAPALQRATDADVDAGAGDAGKLAIEAGRDLVRGDGALAPVHQDDVAG